MGLVIFRPDYTKHGKRAPLVRNEAIALECDELRAFWDGRSSGTVHVCQQAVKLERRAWIRQPGELTWRRFE